MGCANIKEKDTPEYISKQVSESRYFFGTLSKNKSESLELLSAGCEHCKSDYKIERKSFHYYAVEFVFSGKFKLELGGKSYELSPGSVFAYTPRTYHKIEVQKAGSHVKYFADFSGKNSIKILRDAGLDKGPLSVTDLNKCMEIFELMVDCVHYDPKDAKNISVKLLEILALFIRQNSRKHLKNDGAYDIYSRCRNLIVREYESLSKIEDVAAKCAVSSAYLSRLFKKYSEENPYKFLTRLKMNKAASMLLNGNASVKECSACVGFDDQYHFSKAFKKFYGVSPSEFKKL